MAARAELANEGVPAERRLELLKDVPAFAHLPTPALEELAELLSTVALGYPGASVRTLPSRRYLLR